MLEGSQLTIQDTHEPLYRGSVYLCLYALIGQLDELFLLSFRQSESIEVARGYLPEAVFLTLERLHLLGVAVVDAHALLEVAFGN